MANKKKLQELLDRISPEKGGSTIVKERSGDLPMTPLVSFAQEIESKFSKVDADSTKLEKKLTKKVDGTVTKLESGLSEMGKKVDTTVEKSDKATKATSKVALEISKNRKADLTQIRKKNKSEMQTLEQNLKQDIEGVVKTVDELPPPTKIPKFPKVEFPKIPNIKPLEKTVSSIAQELKDHKQLTLSRFTHSRGGSQNRQIRNDGTDSLTKFTDINFIGGDNVTITAADDNTNKRVDITFAGAGGGGSVVEDVSSQCDGSNRVFTVASVYSSGTVDVSGTDFPGIFRPIVDFTETSSSVITLSSDFPAPRSIATLIIKYGV